MMVPRIENLGHLEAGSAVGRRLSYCRMAEQRVWSIGGWAARVHFLSGSSDD